MHSPRSWEQHERDVSMPVTDSTLLAKSLGDTWSSSGESKFYDDYVSVAQIYDWGRWTLPVTRLPRPEDSGAGN